MSRLTRSQLVFIARQHYDAGRLADAEGLCRKVLADEPGCAGALHVAGLAADRLGRHEAAAGFLRRAAIAAPDDPVIHADLGHSYRQAGKIEESIAAYRRALDLAPDCFDALSSLAGALHDSGRIEEAIEAYRRALLSRPDANDLIVRLGDALHSVNQFENAAALYQRASAGQPHDPHLQIKLGAALHRSDRLDDAMTAYRAALAIDPRLAEAHRRLGEVQRQTGRPHEAAASFERACELDPQDAQTHLHLGNTLLNMGLLDRSAEAFYRAITLKPGDKAVYTQLGDGVEDQAQLDAAIALCSAMIAQRAENAQLCFYAASAFQRCRHVDAAISAYGRALELDPNHVAALNNLSLALKDAGRLDEAIARSRQAVKSHPRVAACHGNLLYTLHFDPDSSAESLYAEHQRWAARHAEPLKAQIGPHEKDCSPDSVQRRLRIGYVSPNFNVHPVGRFLKALMANHDHQAFEIVCYSSVRRPDVMTDQFRRQADRWVDAVHLPDKALAERIRGDRIDILVDLTMHMADSRLLAFALKPAPIQVTYLAYCSTTGLETIDYRITDPYLDPRDREDAGIYAEQSVRLPETYWCYDPAIEAPQANPLPALSRGHVTFASLNNFCKASTSTLDLWAALLRVVPGSELILHALRGAHRAVALDRFAAAGVDPARLRFFDLLTLGEYFKLHHSIDLALDPFPYPGGTTTCDALWMGVPTVSLVGTAAFTRSGLSILSNAGLPRLATHSQEQYLETAIALAGDLGRLATLRAGLREQMKNSPLMNGPRFARNMESLYRTLWQRWCETH